MYSGRQCTVLSKDYGIKFNEPSAQFCCKLIPFPFDKPATLLFEVHHNLILMIMESTNEKTLFEVSKIQLSYKSKVKASLRPKISASRDAEKILRQYWNDDLLELQEEIKIMLLNRYNKLLESFQFLKEELQVLSLIQS
jgi:hypothetical protein